MPKVLKAKEAAKSLRISMPTFYKLVQEGRLRATKVGKLWRVSEENIKRFLAGK